MHQELFIVPDLKETKRNEWQKAHPTSAADPTRVLCVLSSEFSPSVLRCFRFQWTAMKLSVVVVVSKHMEDDWCAAIVPSLPFSFPFLLRYLWTFTVTNCDR